MTGSHKTFKLYCSFTSARASLNASSSCKHCAKNKSLRRNGSDVTYSKIAMFFKVCETCELSGPNKS